MTKFDVDNNEFKEVSKTYFNLLMSLTVLSGTIFASTIALSQNKIFNPVFFVAEFFLFTATLVGFLILWSQLKSDEWGYFFDAKAKLELQLKDVKEDFLKKAIIDLINDYIRLMDKKGFSYKFLQYIKVDDLPTLFFITFILGLILMWLSIFFNNYSN